MADDTNTNGTDNAASDKGAAGTSGTDTGGKPAEWIPPATKEDYDKAISEAVQAVETKYKAPDKYEGLKLPDKITVDSALVERTAATLRELGLSQDKAQKALDFVASEAARERDAALSAFAPPSEENPQGGARWREQDAAWKDAALKDPYLGDGKPDQLKLKAENATKVLAKFGDEESIDFVDSALGSNPALLRVLNRIYDAMGEKALVRQQGESPEAPKKTSEIFYPHGANLPEGDPRLAASTA